MPCLQDGFLGSIPWSFNRDPVIPQSWILDAFPKSQSSSRTVGLIRMYHKSLETYNSSPIFPCCFGNFEVNITHHPSIQSLHRLSVRVEYTHLDLYDLYICTATRQNPRLAATRLIPGIMQGHRQRALPGFCGSLEGTPPSGSSKFVRQGKNPLDPRKKKNYMSFHFAGFFCNKNSHNRMKIFLR